MSKLMADQQRSIKDRLHLDWQMDFYHRLQRFNTLALAPLSVHDFAMLVAESIIDLFEIEFGIVTARIGEDTAFASQGLPPHHFEDSRAQQRLSDSLSFIPPGSPVILTDDQLHAPCLQFASQAAGIRLSLSETDECVLLAGSTPQGSRIYDAIDSQRIDAFAVFAQLVASHLMNLTDRHALKRSEQLFHTMFDNAAVGMVLSETATGRFLRVNHKLCEITGYSEAELLSRTFLDLSPPENREKDWDLYQSRVKGQSQDPSIEKHYRRKDGSLIWVRVNVGPIRTADGIARQAISVVEDIEDRKTAEATLRLQSAALESAANSILITDAEGIILWVNPAFTHSTGYTLADVIGQNPRILKSGEHDGPFYKALWDTITSGRIWEGEIVNRRKDHRLMIENNVITPLKNPQGKVTHFIAIKQDITARKQLEAELIQAQKMEAIGQMAGGVAHDFNNNLSVILGYCEMMLEPGVLEMSSQYVREIQMAANHSADLTRQLLAFSHRDLVVPVELELNTVINNSLRMLGRIVGEHISLGTRLEPQLQPMRGDASNMNQVIMNLVVNARDAMPQGGRITISTGNIIIGDAPALAHNPAKRGPYICLSVQDTGCGMSPEVKARIFEPFFTTKGKLGTGLGLSVVFGIVQQHHGWIEVESVEGQGTTFRIFFPALPAATCPAPKVPPPERSLARRQRSGRILLLEDEQALNILAQKGLQQAGYQVTATMTVADARANFDREGGRFDFLFTDVILPDGNGFDLAGELHALNPQMGILITSGYTDERSRWGAGKAQQFQYLPKPYSTETLLAALDRIVR